jgi:membrane-associated phospholipid phosphatase
MFDVDPVIWLQSWASPALTAVMNGISTLGYTRAYVAIAALLAFGFRLRAAVPLLVLLALNAAFTDIAKTAASLERPDADARVQSLSLWTSELRHRHADTPTEVEDSYGFPSGHVSTTTTFAVGLGLLLRWRKRGWTLALVWVAAMALSRMYLGRHFVGDVIGGVFVGLGTIALAFGALKLAHLVRESRKHHPWPAHRIVAIAGVCAGGALLVGLPDAGDAGRLLGTAIGALYLVHHDVFARLATVRARVALLTAAAAGFGAAWWVMEAALGNASPESISATRLAASALPSAALLIVPALVPPTLFRGLQLPQVSEGTSK